MLHYAVVFLVIALVAALFGFGGIAAGAVGIAKILCVVFLIMALVTFVMGLVKKGLTRPCESDKTPQFPISTPPYPGAIP